MKLLLVYGTGEGQTEKICRFMAEHLAGRGHQTRLVNAAEPGPASDPRDFDFVVIAASLHAGRYQSALVDYVKAHHAAIDARPNSFVSVSLAAASDDRKDVTGLNRCVIRFERDSGWKPRRIHHVAGAFRYTAYGLLKRWAMRYIAYRKGGPTDTSRDHELTNWDDLTCFADSLVTSLANAPPQGNACKATALAAIPTTRLDCRRAASSSTRHISRTGGAAVP